jgi:hypothetical protein
MKLIYFLLLFFCVNDFCFGQLLEDKIYKEITIKGLDYLYNQKFEQSRAEFQKVQAAYPNHPVSFLLNAIQLQNEFPDFEDNSTLIKKYLIEVNKCITTAKVIYKEKKYKQEATFYLLAAHGYLALYLNNKNENLAAGNEAKKAYGYFLEGKKYKNENAEFLFVSGLYNFYRIQYPASHPITKPIFMFFDAGSKTIGMAELEASARNSVFSKTEAALHIINVSIKYESNFKKALVFSNLLNTKYPNNYIFRIKHIESLLLNSDYENAATFNHTLSTRKDKISTMAYLVFDGYIEEHQNNNLNRALISYAKALKIKSEIKYTKEYHAIAYLGMARVFAKQNEISKAKSFYKQSLEIAEYEWIKKAAKSEMSKLK